MGYLERIEAKRAMEAVEIQRALDTKPKPVPPPLPISPEMVAEIERKKLAEAEDGARLYIQESSALSELLEHLRNLGYPRYFQDVASISGYSTNSGLKRTINFIPQPILPITSQNPNLKVNSLLFKQEGGVFDVPEKKFSASGFPVNSRFYDRAVPAPIPVGRFHLKNYLIDPRQNLEEPGEIGIGISLSNSYKHQTRIINEWKVPYKVSQEGKTRIGNHRYATFLHESWVKSVVVWITSLDHAIIRGSIQQETDPSDMKIFDDALARVMSKPKENYYRSESSSEVDARGNPIEPEPYVGD